MENEALESKSSIEYTSEEPPKKKGKIPLKAVIIIALSVLLLVPLVIVSVTLAPTVYLYANGFAERTDGTLHFVKGHNYLINSKGEYTIPSSFAGRPVSAIDAYAFDNNKKLRHLTIEEGITTIAESAFMGCHRLESVSLPSTLLGIYSSAFWDCISLREVTLPNSLETIGSYAFAGCEALTRVALPAKQGIYLDGNTFFGCPSIVEFICPENSSFTFDKELGLLLSESSILLFQNINGLEELSLPEGTGYVIQPNAFAHHPELKKIDIPEGVYIRKNAFFDCPNLTIYAEADVWSSYFEEGWNPENIPVVYNDSTDTKS